MSRAEAFVQQKALLEQQLKMKRGLPHLYRFKHYKWSRAFFESTNDMNFLCAANQISKSSTQIRKAIHWATCKELWPILWRTPPRQFWYLYPSLEVATVEFREKWAPEFMPQNEYAKHPVTGWTVKYKSGMVHAIHFNSGCSIYFKAYSQNVQRLQSGTVHAMFTDEELLVELFDELMLRLAAVDGYFHMVFTATIGQDLWYRTIERRGKKDEAFKDAFKQQVSMYDCLEYEDGDTDTPWNNKKIAKIKGKCGTDNEVKKRVHGRFVPDSGLKYPSFDRYKNVISVEDWAKKFKRPKDQALIPGDWLIYSGVDIGSGGKDGHPSAIVFVAVKPDYTYGVVFRGWRGDKSANTAASDVLEKYRQLRGKLKPIIQSYDWQARDFYTYACRLGESFSKAEKSHELGEDTLNVLFKNNMLDILAIPELDDLATEFVTLTKLVNKRSAKDDFIDAARYCVMSIAWNYTAITGEYEEYQAPKKEEPYNEIEERRKDFFGGQDKIDELDDEIGYYNELMYE